MNKPQFYQFLRQPHALNAETLPAIQEVVREFPYFQAAVMLWIKNLHNIEHIRFNGELKAGAAHIAVRARLFDLLHATPPESRDRMPQPEAVKAVANEVYAAPPAEVDAVQVPVADYFEVSDELEPLGPPVADRPSNEPLLLPSADLLGFEYAPGQSAYELGSEMPPVDWERADSFSFSDWLANIRQKPASQPVKPVKTHQLIDQFLNQDSVRIVPKPVEAVRKIEETVRQSTSENEDLLTETLASIYIRQKHYDKAIHIFEKLRLKYPEKSIYFANRISELKNLSNNQ